MYSICLCAAIDNSALDTLLYALPAIDCNRVYTYITCYICAYIYSIKIKIKIKFINVQGVTTNRSKGLRKRTKEIQQMVSGNQPRKEKSWIKKNGPPNWVH